MKFEDNSDKIIQKGDIRIFKKHPKFKRYKKFNIRFDENFLVLGVDLDKIYIRYTETQDEFEVPRYVVELTSEFKRVDKHSKAMFRNYGRTVKL